MAINLLTDKPFPVDDLIGHDLGFGSKTSLNAAVYQHRSHRCRLETRLVRNRRVTTWEAVQRYWDDVSEARLPTDPESDAAEPQLSTVGTKRRRRRADQASDELDRELATS